MNIHIHIHHDDADRPLSRKLDSILHHIVRIDERTTLMSETLQSVKADLTAVEADLSEIQSAVGAALETNSALVQKVADQQAVIDSLKAGDALTEQQIADLQASADAVRDHAEAVAASLRPVAPPASEPVAEPAADEPVA